MHYNLSTYRPSTLPVHKRKSFAWKLSAFKAAVTALGGSYLPQIDTYYNSLSYFIRDKASLLLMPAWKSQTVYAMDNQGTPVVLPFGRAGIGTYVNSAGAIVDAPSNRPRFMFHPVTHEYLGYFHEGARSNYIPYNSTPSATNLSGATHTTFGFSGATSPYGNMQALYRTGQSSNSSHITIASTASLVNLDYYTVSCFVKQNVTAYAKIGVKLTSAGTTQVESRKFVFATGTFDPVPESTSAEFTETTFISTPFPNGWHYISISFRIANPTSGSTVALTDYGTVSPYSSNYIAYPQQSEGIRHLPSIILTGASAVTYNGDAFRIDSSNVFTYLNNAGSAAFFDLVTNEASTSIPARPGYIPDPARILRYGGTQPKKYHSSDYGTGNCISFPEMAVNQRAKIVSGWGGNRMHIANNYSHDFQPVGVTYSGTMLASPGNVSFFFGGTAQGLLRSFALFNRDLSPAEIKQLTTIKP